MTLDHDPNTGRFIKGNRAASGSKQIREMREAIKEELTKCAYSLLEPYETIHYEGEKVSRYQYIVNEAVKNGNTKLITWITEMVVGKPKNIENDDQESPAGGVFVPLTKEHQNNLLEMAMQARLQKEKEEKKGFIE